MVPPKEVPVRGHLILACRKVCFPSFSNVFANLRTLSSLFGRQRQIVDTQRQTPVACFQTGESPLIVLVSNTALTSFWVRS